MHFWNLDEILDILKQNLILTDFVFPIIQTLKTWLEKYLKNLVSEDPLRSNIVTVPKHYWSLHHSTFVIFNDHCQENWVGKKFLLLTCKILGFHVNTLSTDEKYSLLNRDNLMIPIQMQLSQKQKTFSQTLAAFLKSRLNLEYFFKKDDPHRFIISEVMASEILIR